jgi:hypothetical protein
MKVKTVENKESFIHKLIKKSEREDKEWYKIYRNSLPEFTS